MSYTAAYNQGAGADQHFTFILCCPSLFSLTRMHTTKNAQHNTQIPIILRINWVWATFFFYYPLYCLFDVYSFYFTNGGSRLSDNNIESLIRVKHVPHTRSLVTVLLPGRSPNSRLCTRPHAFTTPARRSCRAVCWTFCPAAMKIIVVKLSIAVRFPVATL